MNDLKIFSGPANPALTQDICRYLNLPMGKISLGRFPDGEISCKIDEDVRGRDVFIVQSTCPPVNEHIMELLVMIDSFKRASSFRITAVIPYFGYARQDRKDAGRVPITAPSAKPLEIALAKAARSGSTPNFRCAPPRQSRQPIVISSKTSSVPFFVHRSRTPSRNPGSGSTPRVDSITTAARFVPWAAKT